MSNAGLGASQGLGRAFMRHVPGLPYGNGATAEIASGVFVVALRRFIEGAALGCSEAAAGH